MQKNQKPTLSSVRTPALGLLAALALAFGAPSLHAADKSELLSGAREKVTEVKDSLKKDSSKLQDKAASQKDKAKEATSKASAKKDAAKDSTAK